MYSVCLISCTIVRTSGNRDLFNLGIAGAGAYDVGQLCHSCTCKSSYMGFAFGGNTSSGHVFDVGVPIYQLPAGV